MHCRVMPKTIKIFYDLRNKQFKREPGAMTIHTPYPCPAEERLGYIVMSDNPVAERLVDTAMTYEHTIEAITDHQIDSWRMVETTTLPADCVSADGRPITKREEENNGRFIKRTMTTYTSGILQHKEVNLGDGLWFAIDTGTKEIRHYNYESPCFCYEPMAGRFNVPINRGDENDPFVRNVPMTPRQVEHRAREAERIAQINAYFSLGAPIVLVAPVAPWRPTADAVNIALTVAGRTVMPSHIKEIVVASAKDEQWECQVCFDSYSACKGGLTDCGHHVCAECVKKISENALTAHEPVWKCPTCRCLHPHPQ